jgi:4-amino-4-deoxy-L-arabinose transferase-like glycosyltransferase
MSDGATTAISSNSFFRSSFGTRVVRSISRHERLFLLLVLAVFLLSDGYQACTTPLWFDEFFTLFFSRISSLPEMLRAIPIDSQPPLQYLLTHPLLAWFGTSELVVRMPELLAYLAVGLLTYRIVRLHGTAVQALFAIAMVMGGFVGRQAYTARPYGLLLAFTALTYACWQVAALREKNRLLPLCGVALGIAGAILSHNLGIVHVGIFLTAGEAARLVQRRRLDGWMLAAMVAGSMALAITWPMTHQSRLPVQAVLHAANSYYKPRIANLVTYPMMVPVPLLGLVAVFGFLPLSRRSDRPGGDEAVSSVPPHEWAATAALCLLLPVMIGITAVAVGQFATRYAIGTSLGLALLGAWGLPRLSRLRKSGQLVLSLSTLCFLLYVSATLLVAQIRVPVWSAQPARTAVSPLLMNAPGDLPIVVANALDYAPEWWYSSAATRGRLIYLADIPYAERQIVFLPELALVVDKAYTPLPAAEYATFLAGHPRFLLLSTGDSHFIWIVSRLASSGGQVNTIAKSGSDALYMVSRP